MKLFDKVKYTHVEVKPKKTYDFFTFQHLAGEGKIFESDIRTESKNILAVTCPEIIEKKSAGHFWWTFQKWVDLCLKRESLNLGRLSVQNVVGVGLEPLQGKSK